MVLGIILSILPWRVLDGVGGSQVPPQTVPQQNHALQAHTLSPLFNGVDKLLLCLGGVWGEGRSGAPAKAQEVEGVDGPWPAQRVQVSDPHPHPSSKTMDHHQRSLRGWWRRRVTEQEFGCGFYSAENTAAASWYTIRGGSYLQACEQSCWWESKSIAETGLVTSQTGPPGHS